MQSDEKIVESLIAGGIVGAALGALLADNREKGAVLAAIAGTALLATYKANERAKQTNLPFYIVEKGNLVEVLPNGQKRFVRKIEKSSTKLKSNFKLK